MIIGITQGAVGLLICTKRQGRLCNERIADVIQSLLLCIITPQFSLIGIKAASFQARHMHINISSTGFYFY